MGAGVTKPKENPEPEKKQNLWGKKGRKRGKSLRALGPKSGKQTGNLPTFPELPDLPDLTLHSKAAVFAATAAFDALDGDGGIGSCLDRELVRQGPDNAKIDNELFFLKRDELVDIYEGDGPFKTEEYWEGSVLVDRACAQQIDNLKTMRDSARHRGHKEIHLLDRSEDILGGGEVREEWTVVGTAKPTELESVLSRHRVEVAKNVDLMPETAKPVPHWVTNEEPEVDDVKRTKRISDEGEEEEEEEEEPPPVDTGFQLMIPQEEVNRRAREAILNAEHAAMLIKTPPRSAPGQGEEGLELEEGEKGEGALILAHNSDAFSEDDSEWTPEKTKDKHLKAWRDDFERVRKQRKELKAQGWSHAMNVNHLGQRPRRRL